MKVTSACHGSAKRKPGSQGGSAPLEPIEPIERTSGGRRAKRGGGRWLVRLSRAVTSDDRSAERIHVAAENSRAKVAQTGVVVGFIGPINVVVAVSPQRQRSAVIGARECGVYNGVEAIQPRVAGRAAEIDASAVPANDRSIRAGIDVIRIDFYGFPGSDDWMGVVRRLG